MLNPMIPLDWILGGCHALENSLMMAMGVWIGPMVVLNEEDPVATLPGQFSTFNSRPGITSDGIPYWVGGISTIQLR